MDIPILLPINQREKNGRPPRRTSSAPRAKPLTAGPPTSPPGRPKLERLLLRHRCAPRPARPPSRHHREETSARPERQEKEGASPWRPGPSRPAGCADEDRDEPLRREDDLAIHPEAGAPRRPGDVSDVLLGQTRGAGPSEPFQALPALPEKRSAFQGALRRPDEALFAAFSL